jgi:hypothetical protein
MQIGKKYIIIHPTNKTPETTATLEQITVESQIYNTYSIFDYVKP